MGPKASNILGACDALAKREYFTRHNSICKYLHFKIMKHYGMGTGENWFKHEPAEVARMNKIEVIYDQTIVTTRPVGSNRPDIIIKDMAAREAYIIDVACPVDINVGKKEREKISKYCGLKAELQKMWGINTKIIPVVIGGLGAVTKNLGDYLAMIPGTPDRFMCQKIGLLGSKRILHDVLSRR